MSKLVLLSIGLLLLFSCRHCETQDCTGFETITLHLVHYGQSESDSVLIRKYAQQTNYTVLVDSIMAQDMQYAGDTMSLYFIDRQAYSLEELQTEYDLEIINLSDSKTIRIFGIEREKATQEVCHGGLFGGHINDFVCNNKLIGFNYAVNAGTIEVNGNEIVVKH